MIRASLLVIMTLAAASCLSISCFAQDDPCKVPVPGQLFCDDFSDGNPRDGDPVTWVSGASMVAVDESLVISGQGFLYADVNGIFLDDSSLRTQANLSAGRFLGVSVREVNNSANYFGYVDQVDMVAAIGIGGDDAVIFDSVPFEFDMTNDVMLQLDAIGNQISFWAWSPDEAMPKDPLVTASDDTLRSGEIYVWASNTDINGVSLGPASSEFRFVSVAGAHIPEPSSVLLMFLGMGYMFACRRRTR